MSLFQLIFYCIRLILVWVHFIWDNCKPCNVFACTLMLMCAHTVKAGTFACEILAFTIFFVLFLQRALMQFSEMQVNQEYPKETKRAQKAQPPPPSQARQKARQLKKKAMQGSNKSGNHILYHSNKTLYIKPFIIYGAWYWIRLVLSKQSLTFKVN